MAESRRGWWVVVLSMAACDGVDEDPRPDVEAFVTLCVAQCENAADGDGCDASAILEACPQVCQDSAFTLSATCLAAYAALVACESDQDFVCNGSVEISGLDWPVLPDRVECADVNALYVECPQATYEL